MSKGENMVERCARALYEVWRETEGISSTWDGVRDRAGVPGNHYATKSYHMVMAQARAAIEALMEPTKPMLFFGMDAMARDDLEPTEDEFRAGFVAALRAALGDQFAALSKPNDEGEGK